MSKDLRTAALPRLFAAIALCLLTGAAAAPGAFARATPRERALEAILGTSKVSTIVSRRVCARPRHGQAACAARLLVDSATGSPAHPLVSRGAVPATAGAPALTGVTPPSAGTPAYLQQAYDLSWLSTNAGSGQTIGVVDAYDDPTAESDLATFRSKYGLAPCTEANGCFSKRDQRGGTKYPTEEQGWALETSLDLDAVSAICPNCHIVLVEAESAYSPDLVAAEAQAHSLGATQISNSWGVEASAPSETELSMSDFSFPGVATVAAAGDAAYTGLIEWPAAYPEVTSAGGTSLVSSGAGPRGWSEKAWYEPATELEPAAGTGSGCNSYEAKPAYQHDSGCAGRSYNDLSATGDPATGLRVYDSSGYGGWVAVGGTSLATPMIAAYYALIGGGVGDQSPSWDYTNAASLYDVVSGSNGSCPSSYAYICSARAGYDGPTGVGSISGAAIAGGPGVGGPGGSYVRSTAPTSAKLEGGVYPNQQEATYWWEYGTSSAYGLQSEPASAGAAGMQAVSVSTELTALTPSTIYHFRLCAQNPSGTVCGYDYTFTTQAAPRPAISGTRAVNVNSAGAELTGVINPNGVAAEVAFEYGTTREYGQHTPFISAGSGTSPQTVSQVIEGLSPVTTYHFRLLVRYGSGTTEPSADDYFTTTAAAPTVESLSASNVGETEATLHATIDAKGEAASYHFSYGSSTAAIQSTPEASAGLGHGLPASATLTGLQPATTYYYEVIASNGQGHIQSLQLSFTTAAPPIAPSLAGGLTGASTAVGPSTTRRGSGTGARGTAPASRLILTGVKVARGVVTARLHCSGRAACRARVLIETRISTGSHGIHTGITAIIARVNLRLGGGRSASRRIGFNSAGLALLRRRRHLRATLLAQQQIAGAFATVARRSITA